MNRAWATETLLDIAPQNIEVKENATLRIMPYLLDQVCILTQLFTTRMNVFGVMNMKFLELEMYKEFISLQKIYI